MLTLLSSYCSWGWLSQEKKGHACINSCGIPLFGDYSKDFHHSCRQNQFIQANLINNAPVHRIPITKTRNSAFTGSYTETPLWYQQFDLRQIRILTGVQPSVVFIAANNSRLYAMTMKAMTFQDDIPSFLNDKYKGHYVLVFYLFSLQDSTQNCHYPKLNAEPLRLELNFTFPRFLENTLLTYPATQAPLPWLFYLWLCSNFRQWHFCHWNYAAQQNSGWAVDDDCQLPSNVVFCKLSMSSKLQFPQAALRTDNARTTTILSQRLRFLQDLFSFSSLRISTRRNYWGARSQCTFI